VIVADLLGVLPEGVSVASRLYVSVRVCRLGEGVERRVAVPVPDLDEAAVGLCVTEIEEEPWDVCDIAYRLAVRLRTFVLDFDTVPVVEVSVDSDAVPVPIALLDVVCVLYEWVT
jgi:hypothetical protein